MTQEQQEPSLDFSGLILGFSSAALYYIGHSEIEGEKTTELNFPLALQNIEIVEILKAKTVGNLDEEEQKLMEHVTSDLRDMYTAALKKQETQPSS